MQHPEYPPLAIDTDFNDIKQLKQACRAFALKTGFEFDTKRSNKQIYTITCHVPDCPWRLYASSVDETRIFRIRTYRSEHSCYGIFHPGNKQATQSFIGNYISEKVKEQPEYRPKDIVQDMKRELGVEINYTKALRAKENALELLNGTHEEGYKMLAQY